MKTFITGVKSISHTPLGAIFELTAAKGVKSMKYLCFISVQPCIHSFCAACYSQWMDRSSDCPSVSD